MFTIRTRHPERLTAIVALVVVPAVVAFGYLIGWSDGTVSAVAVAGFAFIGAFRASLEHPDVPLDRWGRRLPPRG